MSRSVASDELIISSLIANPTIAEAAASCGLSTRTIYRRLEDFGFTLQLSDAIESVRNARQAQAVAILDEALGVLREVMQDPETPVSSRVRAAEIVLARLWR